MPLPITAREPLSAERDVRARRSWRLKWGAALAAVVFFALGSALGRAQVPFISLVDLGIHETGHMLFGWAPDPVMLFAGSALQVAFPLGLAAYFALSRGEMWAAAPLLAWGGTSLRNVGVYIADAPYQRLALWGGENVVHDWAQLLAGRAMQNAAAYAWFANTAGWLLVVGALALVIANLVSEPAPAAPEPERA